jgi:hypothetical protein
VNALTNDEVGKYLNGHFVSSYQKVGTFRLAGDQKQGGNVASYFCTPEGRVLHLVAGPVNAATLLREARWVVETWKLAFLEGRDDPEQIKAVFRNAHAERFRATKKGGGITLESLAAVRNPQERVHILLALAPLAKLEQVYRLVFEKIVGEKVSTNPVVEG